MWWQYIVTFAGSLVVALASVWIAQLWSSKRDYRKALENLRSEVSTNIKASGLICQWVDSNLKALEDGKLVVASCPHLYDWAWVLAKGALVARDYPIAGRLEDLYLLIVVVNDLLRTIEELKWGIGGAMTGIEQRRALVFQATKGIVRDSLLPKLEDVRSLLDKKLKLSSS